MWGSAEDSRMLRALLVVVVFVFVVTSCDAAGALAALAGAALAFEWGRAGAPPGEGVAAPPAVSATDTKEGFFYLPGAPAPYAVNAPAAPVGPGSRVRYPGAIDADEYDSEGWYGHRDRTEGDAARAPYGNPYPLGRVTNPAAADACVDDEANDDELDGDERLAYQGRARNDPERVIAGTMNRRRDMDKYLREDCEISEGQWWWGRHEI